MSSGIGAKWATTSWAKTLAKRTTRAGLNDFQRFQVKVNKQKKQEHNHQPRDLELV